MDWCTKKQNTENCLCEKHLRSWRDATCFQRHSEKPNCEWFPRGGNGWQVEGLRASGYRSCEEWVPGIEGPTQSSSVCWTRRKWGYTGRPALKESWLGKRWKAQGSAYVVASICNRSSWVEHHRFKASLIYLAVLGPSMATWHNLVSENKIKTKPKETNKEFWKAAEHTTLWVVVYSSRWVNECLQCIC